MLTFKKQGEYHPSDLLCLSTYQWVPLANCFPILDATKDYTPFVLDPAKYERIKR